MTISMIPPERAVRGLAQDGLGIMQRVAGPADDQVEVGCAYLRAIADHIYTPASGVAKVALAVAEDFSISPAVRLQAAVKAMVSASLGVTGPIGQAAAQFGADLIGDGFKAQQAALTPESQATAQKDTFRVTRAAVDVLANSDDRIRARVAQAALATVGSAHTKWAAQAAAVEVSRRMSPQDSLTTTLRAGARQAFEFAHAAGKNLAIEPFLEAIPTRRI